MAEDDRRKIEEAETESELVKMEVEKALKKGEKDNKKKTREKQQTVGRARKLIDRVALTDTGQTIDSDERQRSACGQRFEFC